MIELANPIAERSSWLEDRRTMIGASDIPALLGFDHYRTATDVYLNKVDRIDSPDNEYMRAGRALEPVILSLVEEERGITALANSALVRHPHYQHIGCTPDAYVGDDVIIQAKNTSRYMEDYSDGHYVQVQYELGVTGRARGILAYLCRGHRLLLFDVDRDDEMIDTLFGVATEFWEEHILPRVPPDATVLDDMRKLCPRHTPGKSIEATAVEMDLLSKLATASSAKQQWKAVEDQHKLELQQSMGDAESITFNGKLLVTWKAIRETQELDVKRLECERPDIYRAYLRTKPGSRRFVQKAH